MWTPVSSRSVALLGAVTGLALSVSACRPAPMPPAESGEFVVQADLSTSSIRVGDQAFLTLTAWHPDDARLVPPDLDRGQELVLYDVHTDTQPLRGGRARTTIRYNLTSFALGERTVLTTAVTFARSGDMVFTTNLPPLALTTRSALTNDNVTWQEAKAIEEWPSAFPRWAIVLLTAAVLAGLVGILLRRTIRRRALPVAPPPPPHQVALEALGRLRARGWIEQRIIEPFYVELSGIVRSYLEGRFGLRAPERTTDEFLREATASQLLDADQQERVRLFLEQADLVKFARHEPVPETMRAADAAAEKLVRETTPAEEPSP